MTAARGWPRSVRRGFWSSTTTKIDRQLLEVLLARGGVRHRHGRERRGGPRRHRAGSARPHPARRHDAGHGRLSGRRGHQGRSLAAVPDPDRHGHRPRRSRRHDARARRGRRGLPHQAGASRRALHAGAQPAPPQGLRRSSGAVQPAARARGGLAHGRSQRLRATLSDVARERQGRHRRAHARGNRPRDEPALGGHRRGAARGAHRSPRARLRAQGGARPRTARPTRTCSSR